MAGWLACATFLHTNVVSEIGPKHKTRIVHNNHATSQAVSQMSAIWKKNSFDLGKNDLICTYLESIFILWDNIIRFVKQVGTQLYTDILLLDAEW